jgi:diguanylate cyclase (GGDEF)-like protein
MNTPLQVLWVGLPLAGLADDAFGPFTLQTCETLEQAAQVLRTATPDALVLRFDDDAAVRALPDWQALSHAVLDTAVVAIAPRWTPDQATALAGRGVQDLLSRTETGDVARALRLAVERKRIERTARKAYATDLATGLPNHAQLLEHMTHLLALREREPAPMALLVLRIEGLSTAEASLGREAANVLRRKVAVRLRAGLRASDVVAAIGNDAFAVLLAWIDAPGAGEGVAAKLASSLQKVFSVAGQPLAVAVSTGVSQYPEHGKQAEELLRRALGQAAAGEAQGRAGLANRVERGAATAANDEQA